MEQPGKSGASYNLSATLIDSGGGSTLTRGLEVREGRWQKAGVFLKKNFASSTEALTQ